MAFAKITLDGEKLTRENFARPPRAMGILPFWFWNGELDEQEMEWQLREYRDKGIHGLFIHGRFGLKVPYLSEGWFERVKFVIQAARRIGIDIWVYDEMNWPSGTAERQVPARYPHLRQKYLELVVLNVDGPLFTFLEATDSRYVNTGDSRPIAAFACSAEEFERGITHLIDLTPNLSFNKVVPWEAPAGKWKLLYFLEKEIDYYIDTLDPESTRRFLELTHEGYKKAVGEEFGAIVPGFYTDEPAMYYYQVGVDNYVVPWSSRMFKIFRKRRGYDLKPWLPALYADMGERTAAIRYDFWRTLTEQYADSYYKQIRDWCDENGVIFTGHLLFEEWLRGHARCEGNIFKYLKHMHLIGVDHLYPKIGSEEEPAEHVSLKMASSAAHHFGSTRLLCESMGGTYWDCTLERMKWIANWEYVLGVNLFNNHGYHYSIEGERKRDWPPSQFYHHTWWKYYSRFTTYMARLGHALSGGRHVAKILILYPINSIWTNYTPQERNRIGTLIESDYNYLTDTLLRLHFDFDYVDEDVLIDAGIAEGKIRIAEEAYDLLILPPLTHVKADTFTAIEKFASCGGRIIADTLLPLEFLESSENEARWRVKELFGTDPLQLLQQFESGAPLEIKRLGEGRRLALVQGQGLHQHKPKDEFMRLLGEMLTPDVIIGHEAVFYLHRIKDGHDLYFLVNTLQQELGRVEVSFEKSGTPELWDPDSGEIRPLHVHEIRDGRLVLQLDFPPAASHFVIIGDEQPTLRIIDASVHIERFDGCRATGYADAQASEPFIRVDEGGKLRELHAEALDPLPDLPLGSPIEFSLEGDNVLCISRWKMRVEEAGESGLEPARPDFNDKGWLDVTLGAWEMQLPQEREEESYPAALWYRTRFLMDCMPGDLRLLIDGFSGSAHRLFINGEEIKDKGRRSPLDAEIREVDIHPFIRTGRNVVAVRLVAERRTDGILDLLKIVGPFALAGSSDGYRITEPAGRIAVGDWTKQGYPFFSGTGLYTFEVDLPPHYLQGKLLLAAECGEDVLEVSVNGDSAGILPWHPYRIDLTGRLQPGRNRLTLKVTNTLINILEAVQKPSGLFAEPRLIHMPVYEFTL